MRGQCVWAMLPVLLLAHVGALAADPAEIELIRKEMQQLRQDYEQRMRLLDERLRKLEPGSAAVASTAPPAQPGATAPAGEAGAARSNAVARAQRYANEQYRSTTESRDYALGLEQDRQFVDRVEHVLHDFVDINGYLRAGYGRNDQGGPMIGFQAPGAPAKYRLGNEAENYGELTFSKSWHVPGTFSVAPTERPDGTPSGPIAHAQVRLGFSNPYGGDTDFTFPEAWASIGNVWDNQPSMKFWAGNRYYRRQDIHINDFFFYNMSGGGGGIDDVDVGFGKLAFTYIGNGGQSGIYTDVPQPDPKNEADFSKGNFDLSLYDVAVPLGKGEFALVFANMGGGYDASGNQAADSQGFGFTFLHTREKFLTPEGINKLSLQAGTGPALTFTSGFETFTDNAGDSWIRLNPDDAWRFRLTEHFVIQPSPHFSIGPALVYQYTDYADAGGEQHWLSAGVRPVVHFNKYVSLAFEGGADYVDNHGENGVLSKFTLAPQVSLGGNFMSRPVIRAFVTYAHWGDEFKGQVGGNDYLGQRDGFNFGMQMETWW